MGHTKEFNKGVLTPVFGVNIIGQLASCTRRNNLHCVGHILVLFCSSSWQGSSEISLQQMGISVTSPSLCEGKRGDAGECLWCMAELHFTTNGLASSDTALAALANWWREPQLTSGGILVSGGTHQNGTVRENEALWVGKGLTIWASIVVELSSSPLPVKAVI